MNWHHYAACRSTDPELFFPVGTTDPALEQLGEAKVVCAGCAVQSMCLEWAILAGIDHGVWGGTSEEERRTVRRRTARQRHAATAPV